MNAALAVVFPPPLTLGLLVGLEALIAAGLLYVAAPAIRRRWSRRAGLVRPIAWLAGITGAVLVLGAVFGDTTPYSSLPNPVPDTVTSVTAGRDLYLANCAACHGVDAQGGGPLAGSTQIRPPSLTSGHLNQHTDGDIFYWISTGLPGGMPAWETKLSETDRWNLVNYLRSINGRGPSPAPVSSDQPSESPPAATTAVVPKASADPLGAHLAAQTVGSGLGSGSGSASTASDSAAGDASDGPDAVQTAAWLRRRANGAFDEPAPTTPVQPLGLALLIVPAGLGGAAFGWRRWLTPRRRRLSSRSDSPRPPGSSSQQDSGTPTDAPRLPLQPPDRSS